jgi:SAM-dependent methyltransferase
MDALCAAHERTPNAELEARFGGPARPIDKQAFDRVIARIKAAGGTAGAAQYMLRIQCEHTDAKTGVLRLSNLRTTILGLNAIQDYCRADELPNQRHGGASPLSYELKSRADADARPVDLPEWGMRLSLQREENLPATDGRVRQTVADWSRAKKVFRLIKRYSFTMDAGARVDMSVVRSSAPGVRGNLVPTYTFAEAGITGRPEKYEIEVEVQRSGATGCAAVLRKTTRLVLAAIQDSNYPIPASEQTAVLVAYQALVGQDGRGKAPVPRDFIGPSSVSLERANVLASSDADTTVLAGYAVTEKADGDRKLVYVGAGGKVYLIDTNMRVQFTGMVSTAMWTGTLLDAEHITSDKFGGFYNGCGIFDAYFVKGADVRAEPLVTPDKRGGRLGLLSQALAGMDAKPLVQGAEPMKMFRKAFYTGGSIFDNCGAILQRANGGLFAYETDGIMFTPVELPVGANKPGEASPNVKRTWAKSLKWKPPDQNTVDFLVSIKKDPTGAPAIGSLFVDGSALDTADPLTQYQTCTLRVGYSEAQHGFVNPCQDVIDGVRRRGRGKTSEYKPVPFYPSDPPDPEASKCHLSIDSTVGLPLTEDKSTAIEDNSVVEFRYIASRDVGWRWVPIRVRHDKTADLRAGGRNYGNAYHVANNVWSTIHYPVTEEMMVTGRGVPDVADSTYYAAKSAGASRAMRDFHNYCAKRRVLAAAISPGASVLDLGVGKAGDLHKWIALKVGFVLGLDSCRDCIVNPFDGACARYLGSSQTYKAVPPMIFLYGQASESIKDGAAFETDLAKRTVRALLGKGPSDAVAIGAGVARSFGVARDGFNVISAQFSLHYFFRDAPTFNGLLDNVADMCAPGGYFVGSCFDGDRVFRALEGKTELVARDATTMCSIVKLYEQTVFRDDETSLGYAVDVQQDSIGSVQREYLVSFQYLETRLAERGFETISVAEAADKGLSGSVTPFSELFAQVQIEVSDDPQLRTNIGQSLSMTEAQKTISFLNSVFIFRRRRGT